MVLAKAKKIDFDASNRLGFVLLHFLVFKIELRSYLIVFVLK